jgi:chemotaxis protein histidine kinase CheA
MDDAAPQWKPVDETSRRILGVMIEKAKTTPNAYPLTLNSLTTGCNQKNNRDPVMNLEEEIVEDVCERLREAGALVQIEGSGRVSKYRHNLYDWFGVEKVELSILGELLLRGAQTVGDLRQRASRMDPIESLDELSALLAKLQEKGLVEALSPPGRGQIVTHTLYLPHERQWVRKRHGLAPDATFNSIGATPAAAPAAARESDQAPVPSQPASPVVPSPAASTPTPSEPVPSAPYRAPISPSAARQQQQEPSRVTREEFDELVEKVSELEATVEKLSDTIRSLIS